MEEHALSARDQVALMHKNGIRFEICTEDEAADFLSRSNFFFKVKAFDKNFDKYANTGNMSIWILHISLTFPAKTLFSESLCLI
ncbi:hypothetical protein VJ923_09655 [Adlercreutzia sp. R25]|uniref:hypothetical protein n=1 Tax=Adlercreutzia shanghongiae TaxID=3111773 RepID=UPI002DBAEB57|nr:hypothetical protein [Adlercreutzia sp. R25]MEC4273420.1 hypothetical protein [Adlercreutzia sp. R25]